MTPVSPAARPFEDVCVIGDLDDAVDHEVVDEANQRPERHGANAGHDADAKRHEAEDEQADPPFVAVVRSDGLRRNGGVGAR